VNSSDQPRQSFENGEQKEVNIAGANVVFGLFDFDEAPRMYVLSLFVK